MARGRSRMVCSFCRRRKIKCNLAAPCSTCVRFGNKDCDVAADLLPPAAVFKPKTTEIDQLRVRLEHLEQLMMESDAGDDMSFHHNMRPTQYRDLLELRHLGLFRWLALVSLDANIFAAMQRLWPWSKDHIGHNPRPEEEKPQNTPPPGPPQAAFAIGPYDVPASDTAALAAAISAALPHRKFLWMLVDRYFAAVYSLFPVVDENEFRAQVARVAGERSLVEEPVRVVDVAHRDVPTWGLLLVVLRLAHLSLFTVTGKLKQRCFFTPPEDMAYMATAPMSRAAVTVALACLAHRDMVRETLVEVIQLVALLRLHVMVDPTFSSPDVKNHSFTAVLSLLALCRWLNRDPSVMFTPESLTPRHAQLLRKLWYVLLDLGYSFAAHTGNAPMIARNAYDVRPPEFAALVLNLNDTHMDAAVCRTICDFEEIRMLLDDALALASNVGRTVKVAAVEAVLARLWAKHSDLLVVPTAPPISGVDAYTRAVQNQQFLQILFVIMAMLTHLYYHYVRRGAFDRARQERSSLLRMICTQLLPYTRQFLLANEDDVPVGGTFDLYTGNYFLHCLWYTMLYLFSFYLDYRAHWTRVKNDPLHHSRLVPGSDYEVLFTALSRVCDSIFDLLMFVRMTIAYFLAHHQFTRKILTVTSKLLDSCKPEFYINCSVVSAHMTTVEENNEISDNIASFLATNPLERFLGDTIAPASYPGESQPPLAPVALQVSLVAQVLQVEQMPIVDLRPQMGPPEAGTPSFPGEISWLPDYNLFEQSFDWILLDLLLSG